MDDRRRPRGLGRRVLRATGLGLGLSAVLLMGVAMGFGDNFIFLPSRDGDYAAAARSPYKIDDVSITAADGVVLHAWHLKVAQPRATVLYFHGNAGNITDRLDVIHGLGQLDLDVFIPDYRGYGKSGGKPTERGVTLDAEASYAHVTRTLKVPPERIIFYGESLGGGPSLELARRLPCAGVILQCSFTSIGDMAARVVPVLPVGWLLPSKFDNIGKIGEVRVPKLFFATKADDVVPYALSRKLYDSAPDPKAWMEFEDAGHSDIPYLHRGEWLAAIRKFLDQAVPAPSTRPR